MSCHDDFTPGAWVVDELGNPIIHLSGSPSDVIAAVQVARVPEWEGNARLIAAAPCLLAALAAIIEADDCGALTQDDIERGRAAIAKATKP